MLKAFNEILKASQPRFFKRSAWGPKMYSIMRRKRSGKDVLHFVDGCRIIMNLNKTLNNFQDG